MWSNCLLSINMDGDVSFFATSGQSLQAVLMNNSNLHPLPCVLHTAGPGFSPGSLLYYPARHAEGSWKCTARAFTLEGCG